MRKYFVAVAAIGLVCLAGCNKKQQTKAEGAGANLLAAVPGDVDMVGVVNLKEILDYVKKVVPKFMTEEQKKSMPPIEELIKSQMKMSGLDPNKVKTLVFAGYAKDDDNGGFIVEMGQDVDLTKLGGKKAEDYAGQAIYKLADDMVAAKLASDIVVASPKSEVLKKFLDTKAGKVQPLGKGKRAKLYEKLAGMEPGLDLVRFYMLTGQLPDKPADLNFDGAAFYVGLDKGLVCTILTDGKSVDKLKMQIDQGLMGVKMMLSMAGQQGQGQMPLDEKTKKFVLDTLNKLQTSVNKDNSLTIAYRGDLKPIIETAVAFGMKMAQGIHMSTDQLANKANAPEEKAKAAADKEAKAGKEKEAKKEPAEQKPKK